MATKRMFSNLVIDTDEFCNLPLSTQALYFHLAMKADDDGFLCNAKRIRQSIGATEDELKMLIAKGFLIPFDSGILVIRHWRIHNCIKADRYHETTFLEEKAQLSIDDKKAYVVGSVENSGVRRLEPKWNQNGTRMEPTRFQNGSSGIGLGLDKDIDKDIHTSTFVDETPALNPPEEVVESDVVVLDQEEELVKAKRDITPYNKILNEYNAICTSLPRAEKLSDKRKKAIKRVYTEYGFDQIITGFMKAQASDFLKGNAKDWQANFDWLMNVNNMLKVLEGNYDNKGRSSEEEYLRRWAEA